MAGVSVALVLLPQSIAYATIAGLPAEVGLFAATLPLIIAAPFVCCPWLQTGPTAMTSLLTCGALATLAFDTPAEKVAAAAQLALIIGCTRFTMGICGFGGFTKLFSRPVILGFTTGAAVLIVASQLSKVLGVATISEATNSEPHVILGAANSLLDIFSWQVEAMLVAAATAAFVIGGRRIHRLFPAIFIAMIAAAIYSASTGYEQDTVGVLPGGFISLNFDFAWGKFGSLIFPGIVMALVGFAEPASISMTLMEEESREWNANQELCGGGCANLVSGLIGGYPIGGSFSRTSVNKFAGADTSWSGFFTGALILSLLWLTPHLKHLPQAAIGAVVIVAVLRLIKFKEIVEEFKLSRIQGCVAVITLLATLILSPRVDVGIVIGAALGLAVSFWEKWAIAEDAVQTTAKKKSVD